MRTIGSIIVASALVTALSVGAVGALASPMQPSQPGPNAPAAKEFANCTALNKKYPHGVGKPKAKDHVSGSTDPVTTFKHSKPLYLANKKSDRDNDKIACEKL
jgi:Excalibur calcium-binding domain